MPTRKAFGPHRAPRVAPAGSTKERSPAMDAKRRRTITYVGYALLFGAVVAADMIYKRATDADTVTESAKRDELAVVERGDPVMAAAISKAKATLPDFLTLAEAPKPNMERFAVKVAIHDADKVEYFWIDPFAEDNGQFSGRINNMPRRVQTVKMGQTIAFDRQDIVDWMYKDNGRMKGNYTACAILKSAPKDDVEAFQKEFGLVCDF
jgi:uncharacterized protein YegJ (DUF2314 family)